MTESCATQHSAKISSLRWITFTLLILLCFAGPVLTSSTTTATSALAPIVVVGSLNVDIIIPVYRLPTKGETTTARSPSTEIAVGGKGANQAVAAARLTGSTGRKTSFVCRFGNDGYAEMLEQTLIQTGVDVSGCSKVSDLPSGQGIVLLEADGTASSIVLGGSNTAWPTSEKDLAMRHVIEYAGAVLLQQEVPERVNIAVAKAASKAGVTVLLDVGGEDRPIAAELLRLVDYLCPNESELARLTGMPVSNDAEVIAAAKKLLAGKARNVLVTLAERGSVLLKNDGTIVRQQALPVPGNSIVDATAAGDAFRAAFAVALAENLPEEVCLQFAAAAGAVAVSRLGAVPSLPSRKEVLDVLRKARESSPSLISKDNSLALLLDKGVGQGGEGPEQNTGHERTNIDSAPKPALGSLGDDRKGSSTLHSTSCSAQEEHAGSNVCTTAIGNDNAATPGTAPGAAAFPLKFASRLNSMQARRDLVTTPPTKGLTFWGATRTARPEFANDVFGWIARQKSIDGLDLIDFNYPQHLKGLALSKVEASLASAGLATGAVCIRFPEKFHLGAFSNPDDALRAEAEGISVEGCRWAAALGARDLIVWSPYDGYDYNFQINYPAAWDRTVKSFQYLADTCPPGIRVSLEFKPTDESTRFSVVPSTGAALLLVNEVNRPNFGLTLDAGHLFMAGENPGQSVAAVGAAGKLFGLQLGDAHVKLGAEDGLAFGSVNYAAALELVAWLQKVKYDGHVYFDTFPKKEDPLREAEYNIRRFKAMWKRVEKLRAAGIDDFTEKHDAMGVLELLEKVM